MRFVALLLVIGKLRLVHGRSSVQRFIPGVFMHHQLCSGRACGSAHPSPRRICTRHDWSRYLHVVARSERTGERISSRGTMIGKQQCSIDQAHHAHGPSWLLGWHLFSWRIFFTIHLNFPSWQTILRKNQSRKSSVINSYYSSCHNMCFSTSKEVGAAVLV